VPGFGGSTGGWSGPGGSTGGSPGCGGLTGGWSGPGGFTGGFFGSGVDSDRPLVCPMPFPIPVEIISAFLLLVYDPCRRVKFRILTTVSSWAVCLQLTKMNFNAAFKRKAVLCSIEHASGEPASG
jgi:hypothetical protein